MHDRYSKLFSTIVTSSIWVADPITFKVWIAMLALKDSRGYVAGTIPGLANLCGISIEEMERAEEELMAPDQYSRTPDNEGRRIAKADGGWLVLNSEKYDAAIDLERKRELAAERNREYRERKRDANRDARDADVTHRDADVTHRDADVTHRDADVTHRDAGEFPCLSPHTPLSHPLARYQIPEPDLNPPISPLSGVTHRDAGEDDEFEADIGLKRFLAVYPESPATRQVPTERAWKALMLRSDVTPAMLIAAAERYRRQVEAMDRNGTQFVISAQRFLDPGMRCWLEEFPLPREPAKEECYAERVVREAKEREAQSMKEQSA